MNGFLGLQRRWPQIWKNHFRRSGYTALDKEVFNSGGADGVKQLGIIALKPK